MEKTRQKRTLRLSLGFGAYRESIKGLDKDYIEARILRVCGPGSAGSQTEIGPAPARAESHFVAGALGVERLKFAI